MLKQVKPQNLPVYMGKIESIFPEFRADRRISVSDVRNYYRESFWGYALFHSWAGAIHMALSEGDNFSKNDYFRQAEEIEELISSLGATGACRVLEVGCGRGFNLAYLGDRFPAITFVGVDISKDNIRSAQSELRSLPNVSVRISDFHELSEVSEYEFDIVFGVETLCHAIDLSKALKAISRVLKPGGHLVVFDGFRSSQKPADELVQRAVVYTERAMAVSEFRTQDKFVESAEEVGFALKASLDRSAEIMPNLIRLSDLAKAFFKLKIFSRLILMVLPRGLVTNAVAGLLMAVTVQLGAHKYLKLTFTKA